MKTNGRRAWRKWAHYGWGREYNWRTIRRHPDVGVPQFVSPELKPRPFAAVSLVGMTMGARKRAAWAEIDKLSDENTRFTIADEIFKIYRVGERLRPCFGCCACKSRRLRKREGWACGPFMVTPNTLFMFGLGPVPVRDPIKHELFHCDGSGVLPAKGGGKC